MKLTLLRAFYPGVTPESLKCQYKKCTDYRLKERYFAILQSFTGSSPPQIAELICRTVETVRTWLHQFIAQGEAGLKRQSIPGRPCRLSEDQLQDLAAYVASSPREQGFRTNNWTSKTVRRLILQKFRVKYSRGGVCALLHRLGFRMRKPWYSYRAADPDAGDLFFEELQQEIDELSSEWMLVAVDEATLRLHPTLHRCWALKGASVEIPTWGTHQKTHIYAALTPNEGTLAYRTFGRLNSTKFTQFLTHLLTRWPNQKLLIILDNARYHTSQIVNNFLNQHAESLKVKFLPIYSPKLNPVEDLFHWLRQEVTHNHPFETMKDLVKELHYFFSRVRNSPTQLKSRCPLKAEILF